MLETAVLCARLFLDAILFFSQYSIPHSIISLVHRRTYRAVKSPETIVVVCAGFAGHQLALQLANRIPAGYRVVLIEKNSYFNFSWIVPRLSVVSGHDHKAFIPYEPSISSAAMGSIELRQGVVVSIDEESVTLQDGEQIRYSFLAIATGTYATPPSKIVAEDRAKGVGILRDSQDQIREANEICVIGGGAVGVEITADIKSYYPGKTVNLIHSRDLLLNRFGPKLHQATMKVFDQLGVNVFLGERPSIDDDAPSEIVLKSGKSIKCDHLVSDPVLSRARVHT